MKRFFILACALAIAPFASAQLYKYVDKDGKTVYSDQPPANIDSKQLNVRSGTAAATPSANVTDAPKSYVDRDKDLQKGREERRESAKKAEDAAKVAQQKEDNCIQARGAYQQYADGGRIHKYNAQGERVYLGDEEMEAEKVRSKREMDEACKK